MLWIENLRTLQHLTGVVPSSARIRSQNAAYERDPGAASGATIETTRTTLQVTAATPTTARVVRETNHRSRFVLRRSRAIAIARGANDGKTYKAMRDRAAMNTASGTANQTATNSIGSEHRTLRFDAARNVDRARRHHDKDHGNAPAARIGT